MLEAATIEPIICDLFPPIILVVLLCLQSSLTHFHTSLRARAAPCVELTVALAGATAVELMELFVGDGSDVAGHDCGRAATRIERVGAALAGTAAIELGEIRVTQRERLADRHCGCRGSAGHSELYYRESAG